MAALEATSYSIILLSNAPKYQLLVTGLYLAAALLGGALVIALLNRWRKRNEKKEDLSPSAQLAQFRSLCEAGTISQEEFDRLRAVLSGQIREPLKAPTPPAPAPGEPPSETDELPPDPPETGIRPG